MWKEVLDCELIQLRFALHKLFRISNMSTFLAQYDISQGQAGNSPPNGFSPEKFLSETGKIPPRRIPLLGKSPLNLGKLCP